ncbi:nuclear transport factor 2 family protein [Mycobacterium sp. HM-7]
MTRDAPHNRHRLTATAERRVLHAAIALGAVAAISVGTAPITRAATIQTASAVSAASANVTDPAGETAAVEMLKATYFNDVDTKNWQALRQLFAPGAQVDTTGSFGPYFPNRDSFIAFTALTLSAINTRHQGYDPQIDLTSDTTASAVWTMQDRLSVAGLITIHGYGHYTDNYEQVNGQWLVTYSKLTRTGFTVEFPAFQSFANGLADAYNAGGPVAALLYVVPGILAIPVSAVKALVGAIASNFGGPPAKADPITVPPGSTGVTTEPPGITSTAATAAAAAKVLALSASTTTSKSPSSSAKLTAAEASGYRTQPAQSAEPTAAQHAVADKPEATTEGNASKSSATDSAKSSTSSRGKEGTQPTSTHTADATQSTTPSDDAASTKPKTATRTGDTTKPKAASEKHSKATTSSSGMDSTHPKTPAHTKS